MRLDDLRDRYVRAHAGLRSILSRYISIEPQAIVLKYACAGKPTLGGRFSHLDFNLTTSGDLALVGLSVEEPVGVDCEQVRDRQHVVAIAKRMFAPEEASRIALAAAADRLERFHVAWTALEATVKADGRGLFRCYKQAAYSGLDIRHCIPAHGFIAAVARRHLPPAEDWVTLELSPG